MSLFPVKMVPEGGRRRDASPHFYRCCPIIVHMDIFGLMERERGGQKPFPLSLFTPALFEEKEYFVVEGGQPKKEAWVEEHVLPS